MTYNSKHGYVILVVLPVTQAHAINHHSAEHYSGPASGLYPCPYCTTVETSLWQQQHFIHNRCPVRKLDELDEESWDDLNIANNLLLWSIVV